MWTERALVYNRDLIVSGNPVGCWEQGLLVSPLHWARNGQSLVILLPSR